jgi:hypothetical protein
MTDGAPIAMIIRLRKWESRADMPEVRGICAHRVIAV